jgi:hypothetical protein
MRSNAEALRRFLVEQFYDVDVFINAMKRGEVDIFDPEIVYEDAELPDHVGEVYRGYERVLHSAETWREGGGHMTLELSEIVGQGDELVSIHTLHVKTDHAGIELDGPVAYHWTFRNGKVVHLRGYGVPEEALAAAGLRAAT